MAGFHSVSPKKSLDSLSSRFEVAPRKKRFSRGFLQLFLNTSGNYSSGAREIYLTPSPLLRHRSLGTQVSIAPFAEHLKELRNRAGYFFLSVVVGAIVAYIYHDFIVELVTRPLNQSLFFSSPGGGFDFMLKLSFLSGLFLCIPIFIYQVLRFVEPVFSKQSRFFVYSTVFASYMLLLAGASFAYWVALPLAITFLNGFASEQVQSLILTTEYLNFLKAYLIGFGIAFQLPIILWVINAVHPFSKGQLWKAQKWVILFSFLLAAIITPTPDVMNMLIMAAPVIFLYHVSMFLVWWKNESVKKNYLHR